MKMIAGYKSYVTTLGILVIVAFSGCGGNAAPASHTQSVPSSAGDAQTPAASTAPVSLPVRPESTPNEVVMAFLHAMRDGNSTIASELLTDQARAETTKHQWPVQPPGAPSATYQVGEPKFVDASKNGVHIPCLWSESDGAGGSVQFEVTWALRQESQGWRVAGFATEVIAGKDPYYFNFEDIEALKSTQLAAETALHQATSAESAAALAERPTNSLR